MSLKDNGGQEVLPPTKDADGKIEKINLVPGKDPNKVVLITPGNVKSEMARIYRAKLKGLISVETADSLIKNNLLPILKATEIEQAFRLAPDDENDDRPALTGLTITGPISALPEGAPRRSLDGISTTTIERENDDQDNG